MTHATPAARPRRRGWLAAGVVGVTALLTGAGTVVGVPAASAATVDPNAWYVLVARHSGKALDLYNLATNDGAPLVQWPRNDGAWQQWQFVDSGGGFYRLRSRHSGKVVAISGNSTADGAAVVQMTDTNATSQQFRLVDSDSGYVRVLNRNSGKALDVNGRSTADAAPIIQWADANATNQQWQLVPLGSGTPNPPAPPPPPPPPPPSDGCGSGAFNAEVTQSGGTWTARNGTRQVYSGGDTRAAIQAAVDSLTAGRTSKQRVVVRGSGSMSAGSRISLPSFTTIAVCGTINVTGSGSGDQAPIYSRSTRDVEVQNLTLTGNPLYGIFLRSVDNVILGRIDMRLSAGLGVRIDNHANRAVKARNVRIDDVFVSGASSHAVETYGVDGLTVNRVTARNVGESGLLLNDTINATVGTVDAQGAGAGTGYAAFRMANRNGRIGSSYPTNIRVGTVIARNGGRGIFCVSESGGAVVDRVDIAQTGNNAILIENCYNVSIAAQGGTISGGGEVRLAARSEFPNNADITLQNFTLVNSRITESPCGTNIVIRNITLNNSQINRC
jgi:hypothetical protein